MGRDAGRFTGHQRLVPGPPSFNPASGRYGLNWDEEGATRLCLGWKPWAAGLDIRPGWGWKQKLAENFWVPSIELQWLWDAAGIDLRIQEYTEQPAGRWGAEDHWEHTQASLTWQFWTYLFLTGRWEKIYDGFLHDKYIQLSAEVQAWYEKALTPITFALPLFKKGGRGEPPTPFLKGELNLELLI